MAMNSLVAIDDLAFSASETIDVDVTDIHEARYSVLKYDVSGAETHNEKYVYSHDGVRVRKSVGAMTTDFVIDADNPTGYAQVFEERVAGAATRSYTIGRDVHSQHDGPSDSKELLYDAHGSTRGLLTGAAFITGQKFTYDAYGNPIGFTLANAASPLLYSGEYTEVETGNQYLRNRILQPSIGRFTRLDPFNGNSANPLTLHGFGYVHGDPVNGTDPLGLFLLAGIGAGFGIGGSLRGLNSAASYAGKQVAISGIQTGIEAGVVQTLNATVFKDDPIPFSIAGQFGQNVLQNVATGKLKGFYIRNLLDAAIGSAFDIAHGGNVLWSIAVNAAGAFGGELLFEAIAKRVFRRIAPFKVNAVSIPQGHSRVYRAVGESEYNDILSTGTLRVGTGSMEGKWFAESLDGAKKHGHALYGEGNFRLIEVDVPNNAPSLFRLPNLDGLGPATFLHINDLVRVVPRPLK